MLPEPFRNAVVLTGPTACGKTALALELAEHLSAEIIAMDSMTVYRGMDIGTAKPSPVERQRVPHHLIDVREPRESANVAWWLEQARECALAIAGRRKRVLFVGGTALYLKALLKGLFEGPGADATLRNKLQTEAETVGSEVLHARLAQVDPSTAARLHPNDLRRIIRALEVWQITGRPLSDWQQQWRSSLARHASEEHPLLARRANNPGNLVWLDLPRAELYRRIEERVDRMFALGFVEEVQRLKTQPHPPGREARQALGYKEVFDLLDGKQSLAQTVATIKTRTRNFAKRQLTWFRNMPECRPCRPQRPELTFTIHDLTIS